MVVAEVLDMAMFGLPKTRIEWITVIFCLFITVLFLKIYLF
ncbi:hypothetical protein ymoll0001_10080 [Yersinia mollaretii ATCC 43969]|uniref:Uncharacterized protein n=1 Tax=Yersinia mollaretii (strain ATCC 43969 / DSM 18520 / CIP 103324 / CNY 7263 / WAIP 204) TaxID=349967 RepID=A0ABM9YEH8_YERMW|nr:hypothetical protein ymoll0001_10080 [Yersinia mollaretii ATCC 43969]CQD36494.1 Uncharacterised protein [Yersinia mollaretii]CQH01215.1 Uncharacterised protein [Yersinia mollaretii]